MAIGVLGGCAVGLGLFLVVREALPATPALGPALRRQWRSRVDYHAHDARAVDLSSPW
ncbi:secretion system protein, partial [Micromonospora tulbaghiae]